MLTSITCSTSKPDLSMQVLKMPQALGPAHSLRVPHHRQPCHATAKLSTVIAAIRRGLNPGHIQLLAPKNSS